MILIGRFSLPELRVPIPASLRIMISRKIHHTEL